MSSKRKSSSASSSLTCNDAFTSLGGAIRENAAIVPAGASGGINVFATNATDVVLDINGYFVPASETTGLAFYPLTPCRVADTRNAPGALGGPSLTPQGTRTFPVAQSTCGMSVGGFARVQPRRERFKLSFDKNASTACHYAAMRS